MKPNKNFLLYTEESKLGLHGVQMYMPCCCWDWWYNSEECEKRLEAMSAFPLLNVIDQTMCLCPYNRENTVALLNTKKIL